MKTIGYYLFALVYYICRLFPIKPKKVLCIMTHDDGEGSNVSLVAKALKEKNEGYTFSYITKRDTLDVKGFSNLSKLISFFLVKPYQMSKAQIILLDNTFLPLAYLKVKKKTKVIQLWHGTGTIKKFGQDANSGKLKQLEQKANQNITHLIVNSIETKKLYSSAFGIEENRIYPIGLPKTDELLKRVKKSEIEGSNPDKEIIYRKHKIPKDKKLVLYAPTFRDAELHHPEVLNKLDEIIERLPSEFCLGLRLHPFIAEQCSKVSLSSRVFQLSFEPDLTTVLMASDLLITDYSSIVFEYCVTERPMIFYAYDLAEFSNHGRGFYLDYESYVPGPVVYQGTQVADIIKEGRFNLDRIREFRDRSFTYLDGNATNRLLDLL